MPIPSPLKWHGGKAYLAKRIVALMPPHLHYVEPYAGGLAVLMEKDPEGVSEVVNDLNLELTLFWKVLQGLKSFEAFRRLCEATPFSECEWHDAEPALNMPLELDHMAVRAWKFFIWCRQSLAGRMNAFAPLSKNRTRRGMNEQASAWLSAVEGLPQVHERLKRVVILNRPALDVIRQQDGPNTMFYIDAPYVKETRTADNVYSHEMTDDEHVELIKAILRCRGMVQVSMYHHPIYDVLHQKHGWQIREFEIPNNAASGSEKRRMTECLWMNYSLS